MLACPISIQCLCALAVGTLPGLGGYGSDSQEEEERSAEPEERQPEPGRKRVFAQQTGVGRGKNGPAHRRKYCPIFVWEVIQAVDAEELKRGPRNGALPYIAEDVYGLPNKSIVSLWRKDREKYNHVKGRSRSHLYA